MMVAVNELSDLLFVQLKEICTNLEKALPEDVDRLEREHDEFHIQKVQELEKLKTDLRKKSLKQKGQPNIKSQGWERELQRKITEQPRGKL